MVAERAQELFVPFGLCLLAYLSIFNLPGAGENLNFCEEDFYMSNMADQAGTGSRRLRCPEFNLSKMSFEDYKFELELWSEMTSADKTMLAGEIFLSLPNEDSTNIKSYLRSKMTKEDMRSED